METQSFDPGGLGLFADRADASVLRAASKCGASAVAAGVFHVKCFDPDGNLKWEEEAHNLITNLGLNDFLNVEVRGTTQTTAWYLGLIDNASFTALANADAAGSHAGWIENIGYTSGGTGARPQWSPGAAASQSITNASAINFVMTAAVTIRGLFVSSVTTFSATTGLLLSEASFTGGNQAVNIGDTLQCTYTMSLATN